LSKGFKKAKNRKEKLIDVNNKRDIKLEIDRLLISWLCCAGI